MKNVNAYAMKSAYTCPLVGGKAVYKARAYYLLIDREADFDDLSLCLSNSYKAEQQAAEKSANTSPVWKVQPNPASEGLYVFYEQPIDGGIQVQLQATDGRLMRQQTIAEEGSSIVYVNTTELPDGIYLLRVTQNSEHVYQTKVVVKH
ncbi:MAG: T9SS type A sorting domain-containing protein [Chitinophagales bacterium]|nr:T9SS type A sorting domain-containing protein [Chitinophagales bacterium]